MTKFNVLSIDYYKDFECIGNKCEDNCCKDWKITIDKKTYNKYKKLPVSDFSKKLNNNINRDRKSKSDKHYAKINLIDKKCPMFSKDGLCEIYLNLGPENMCYTCRTYPRVYNLVDNTIEKCLTVSCIEVARNILLRKNPIEFNLDIVDIKEEMDAIKVVNTNKGKKINEKCFNEIREFSIGLIQDRRFTIENRLAILGLFINKLNEQCNNKEEVINLIENYKASIENGVYENLLEKLIKECGLESQVKFLGTKNDLYEIYKEYDVGLTCSRAEGFGRVTAEYMYAGLCVIGSNMGATPELIEDNKDGLIYDYQNIHELSRCIERIYNDRELLRYLSKNGKKSAIKFSSTRNAKEIYEVYLEILNEENK